ncbi:MAG: type VI secretion system tip protein VgrG [Candidatus Krumholzibacteria bacterium]|nr:type VI secretion system tip protein VgrG [Candidatus Krumholzibacteria bacterium]
MATYSQAERPLRITTVLGDDVLLLGGFTGDEGVSRPFGFTLDLRSEDADIDPKRMLRSPVTVTIDAPGEERVIHGLVRRFVQLGRDGEFAAYRAEIVPWLWFLSLSRRSKIFQEQTALDIVEAVFRELGHSDFQIRCTKSYPKREYCVQYRETDLNFVSRLLEEEGIFYFFEHADDKHTLVLADAPTAVKDCPGQAKVRAAAMAGTFQEEDVVLELEREHAVHAGKVTLRSYDYLQPSLRLESSVSGDGDEEIYDYSDDYTELDDGERLARIQLEAEEATYEVVRGSGTCRSFRSGYRVELTGHYRSDANQAYHLLSVHHTARGGDFATGGRETFEYRNVFEAVPHGVPYRPPRRADRPVVRGSQTAVVVGKSGEEIWVDKHGRVKVQFHWDRDGKKDENSSCWVRVSSAWAGKNWGAIQLPRLGQEVIVDFLEGNPDRPIITGRVYNAEQTPPYALPSNQTQSGVKSRSSKGGGADNFNEIRFEDKKGSEELFVHAEKDLVVTAKNDERRTIGHDRTTSIKRHDERTVKEGDDTLAVEQGNQTVTIKMGNQTTTLDSGNQEITLKMGNQTVTLKMGNQQTNVKMGNVTTKADLGKIVNEAMQGIELKVGQSSLKIDQTGVTIKGMMVKVEGQIQTDIKGMMMNMTGDAMLKMRGGITMIN